jgi:phenylalanyl-tRNA synthetase beta chain
VDPELPRIAIEHATRLIVEIAGGAPGPVIETVLPEHLPQPQPIQLRRLRLARVLGTQVAETEVTRILTALGLDVVLQADGWLITPPVRRFDMAIEEDLIEEVARIHGYDAIPVTLPGGGTRLVAPSETRSSEHDARRQLVARDYLEAINYAFVDAELLCEWTLGGQGVSLANPLSAELGVMRPSLLPGLVAALARNVARQQSRVRLFEIGKTFAMAEAGQAPRETRRIAAVACGNSTAEQWGVPEHTLDFHDIKGDLDSLGALSGAVLDYRASSEAFAHPGRAADVYRLAEAGGDVRIGWIGQVHPRLQQALGIDVDVLAFELDLDLLLARVLPRARAMSKYPSVRRDLAFVVAESVSWAAMQETVRQAAGHSLRELRLFDRYAGKGVENGFKSLAMGLILQDETRTLIDRDVEAVVAEVVAALEQEHGAAIRR